MPNKNSPHMAISRRHSVKRTYCGISAILVVLILWVGWRFAKEALFQGASSQDQSSVAFDIAPDGKSILFVGNQQGQGNQQGRHNLYLLNLATLHATPLTTTAQVPSTPKFAPDGKSFAYAGAEIMGGPAHIIVQSLDGKFSKQLTAGEDVRDGDPSFSADGSQIVFSRAKVHRPYSMGGLTWDNYDIYTMGRDGTGLRQITKANYYQLGTPVLSKDGKTVLFSAIPHSAQDATLSLFTVDSKGLGPASPLTSVGNNNSASYSPGGSQIVFISDARNSYHYDVVVMTTAGTEVLPLQVTSQSSYNEQPLFMPDGEHILFLGTPDASKGFRYNLYQVDARGGHLRILADSGLFDDPLRWSAKHQRVNPIPFRVP